MLDVCSFHIFFVIGSSYTHISLSLCRYSFIRSTSYKNQFRFTEMNCTKITAKVTVSVNISLIKNFIFDK